MGVVLPICSPLSKEQSYRSEGIAIGDFHFISMQVPGEQDCKDNREEFLYVFKKIQMLLLSRDLGLSDLVSLRVYLTKEEQADVLNEVMQELFGNPKPSVSVLFVSKLLNDAPLGVDGLAINTREMKQCKRKHDGQLY